MATKNSGNKKPEFLFQRNVPRISRVNWTMHPYRFLFPKRYGPLYKSKTFDGKMPLDSGLKVEKAKSFSFLEKTRKNLKTFSIFCKKGDFKGNLYWANATLSHQKIVLLVLLVRSQEQTDYQVLLPTKTSNF